MVRFHQVAWLGVVRLVRVGALRLGALRLGALRLGAARVSTEDSTLMVGRGLSQMPIAAAAM